MRKPNVQAKADQIHAMTLHYVVNVVRPYLQTLLNKAQSRLWRHKLTFTEGMGVSNFDLDGESWNADFQVYDGRVSEKSRRLQERFPWLVEFMAIVDEVNELLNTEVGSMEPTKGTKLKWQS